MGTLVWLALAAPALAVVEDPLSTLDALVDKALDQGMQNLNAAKLDVVFLKTLPQDADGMAKLHFLEQHLDDDGGVIMVATETGNVGVYLGASYTSHGVSPALAHTLVKRAYTPNAQKGDISEGILALVREFKLARTLGRDPASVPPVMAKRGWLPWWWELPPLALVGAYFGGRALQRRRRSQRRRARLERMVDRLEDLKGQWGSFSLARDQVEAAGQQGLVSPAQMARDAQLEAEAESLAEAIVQIGRQLKAGDWDGTEAGLEAAEARLLPLATGLAATLMAHRARLADSGVEPTLLLARADQAFARFQRLNEARARWATEVSSASNAPQQLAERLVGLARVLTKAPLDLAAAEDYLDATEAIYGRALTGAV